MCSRCSVNSQGRLSVIPVIPVMRSNSEDVKKLLPKGTQYTGYRQWRRSQHPSQWPPDNPTNEHLSVNRILLSGVPACISGTRSVHGSGTVARRKPPCYFGLPVSTALVSHRWAWRSETPGRKPTTPAQGRRPQDQGIGAEPGAVLQSACSNY